MTTTHESDSPVGRGNVTRLGCSLDVVIPVLNEENGLDTLLARLVPVLRRSGLDWSVIFVDDGSRDGTFAKLRGLASHEPRLKAIALSRNFGKEVAVAAGLNYARGDATIIMDGDLQHPPEVIPQFIERWHAGFDVVFGQRIDRHADSAWRRIGARFFYRLFHHLSGTELQPRSCDFRLLSRTAREAVNKLGERKRYNNGLFAWIGFKSAGVPFDMPPRPRGDTSRWQPMRLLRFALDGLASFSTIPLRVWSIAGLAVSALAFCYMVVILTKTLVYGDPVRGYPTLMVTVLFLAGIQLISLGIIGEYLGRVYEEVKGRPLYLVREEIGLVAGDAERKPEPESP